MDRIIKKLSRSQSRDRGEVSDEEDRGLETEQDLNLELLAAELEKQSRLEEEEKLEEAAGYDTDHLDSYVKSSEEKKRLKAVIELFSTFSNTKESIDYSSVEEKIKDVINSFIDVPKITCNLTKQIDDVTTQMNKSNDYRYCKANILPPNCKPEVEKKGIRRLKDLITLFNFVPNFDNTKVIDIRSFLTALNSVVSEIGQDISAQEFKYILLAKLSPKVRLLLQSQLKNDQSLQSIYQHLLGIYDLSLTPEDAWNCLTQGAGGKFQTLKDIIEHYVHLMDIAHVEPKNRASLFISVLKNHLDSTMYDRLIEFKTTYSKMYNGELTMNVILDYLSRYHVTINKSLDKPKSKIFNVQQSAEVKEKGCTLCNRPNHTEKNCWSKTGVPTCVNCGKKGHRQEKCLRKNDYCRLCGDFTHKSVHCSVYKNTEPVRGKCLICFEKLGVALYHPMMKCKNKNQQKN
jgi:hypothetical protein